MDVNDLTPRAVKYDEGLARNTTDYVRGRRYGLASEDDEIANRDCGGSPGPDRTRTPTAVPAVNNAGPI